MVFRSSQLGVAALWQFASVDLAATTDSNRCRTVLQRCTLNRQRGVRSHGFSATSHRTPPPWPRAVPDRPVHPPEGRRHASKPPVRRAGPAPALGRLLFLLATARRDDARRFSPARQTTPGGCEQRRRCEGLGFRCGRRSRCCCHARRYRPCPGCRGILQRRAWASSCM